MATKVTAEGFGRLVWAPDPVEGFVLGKLCDIGTTIMKVQLIGTNQIVRFF